MTGQKTQSYAKKFFAGSLVAKKRKVRLPSFGHGKPAHHFYKRHKLRIGYVL